MLTAFGDSGGFRTCSNDVIDKARKRGNTADEEGDDGAPVATESGRVAVDTVEVVHIGHGHVAASDDKVAAAQRKRISWIRDVVGGTYV